MSELTYATAPEQAAALRSRNISARELCEQAIARIERPPHYEDRTPLAFAALVEQAFGGFTPRPDIRERPARHACFDTSNSPCRASRTSALPRYLVERTSPKRSHCLPVKRMNWTCSTGK